MINDAPAACDLLVVSPHPDDAEIGLGGTMAALAARGRRVWALELTRGELGTNAGPDERWRESVAAAEALGLAGRLQLQLPDGFIAANDPGQAAALVAVIRRLRPRWLFTAPEPRRHPDHQATPGLVERAVFLARLSAWQPPLTALRLHGAPALPEPVDRWEVQTVGHVTPGDGRPSLLVDIGGHWPAKLAALACYRSQLQRGNGRRATVINDPAFLERIEDRARRWGRQAGTAHAEAVTTAHVPVVTDLPAEPWRS
jgi:bacillithiol biosynthesis deacetylase BshB1